MIMRVLFLNADSYSSAFQVIPRELSQSVSQSVSEHFQKRKKIAFDWSLGPAGGRSSQPGGAARGGSPGGQPGGAARGGRPGGQPGGGGSPGGASPGAYSI